MGESEQAKTAIDYAIAHNIRLKEALWRIRRQGYTVPEIDHEDAVRACEGDSLHRHGH